MYQKDSESERKKRMKMFIRESKCGRKKKKKRQRLKKKEER